ncbi:MAG: non-homologous end-joining DNA ligase [Shinella sp.]|nr:non-homologous end-joining DNA ligase [Shinella sp.]
MAESADVQASKGSRKAEGRPRKSSSASRTKEKPDDRVAGIRITHPDRMLFGERGIRKIDLARYYAAAAPRLLEHAGGHPVSLIRCPQGDIAHCFFQKHASEGFPREIAEIPIEEASGKTEDYMVVNSAAGLAAAVQMGTIEFHIWGSAARRLETPNRMIFDLDPDTSVGFSKVRDAALELRDMLAAAGLKSLAMVTGGKGVHVVVPLVPRAQWPDVKAFAKALADKLADEYPDRYVATMSKAKREGRIFIDWLRNERGATAVAPYSVRARSNAPVAAPVTWEELQRLESANGFFIDDMAARLNAPDPWQDAKKWRQSLTRKVLETVAR